MDIDAIVKVILIGIVISFILRKDKKSTDYKKEIEKAIEEKPLRDIENMLKEENKPVYSSTGEMFDSWIKVAFSAFFLLVFTIAFLESFTSKSILVIGGYDTGLPMWIFIGVVAIVIYLISLKPNELAKYKAVALFIVIAVSGIGSFIGLLFSGYSVIANIIHFEIWTAILWTIAFIFFLVILAIINNK